MPKKHAPPTPNAANVEEEISIMRDQIEDALRVTGMNPTELAAAIGKERNYIRDFLNGRKLSMSATAKKDIDRLAARAAVEQMPEGARDRAIKTAAKYMEEDGGTIHRLDMAIGTELRKAGLRPIPRRPAIGRDLPVFAAVEGGTGVMVIPTEPVDFLDRPWFFQHVPEAYAVLVVGDSMEPVFEPGDMALVNPRLPPIRGKEALFIATKDGGDWRASLKRFVRATDTAYVVNQFNPAKQLELDRTEWQQAFRVVGKYNGT